MFRKVGAGRGGWGAVGGERWVGRGGVLVTIGFQAGQVSGCRLLGFFVGWRAKRAGMRTGSAAVWGVTEERRAACQAVAQGILEHCCCAAAGVVKPTCPCTAACCREPVRRLGRCGRRGGRGPGILRLGWMRAAEA